MDISGRFVTNRRRKIKQKQNYSLSSASEGSDSELSTRTLLSLPDTFQESTQKVELEDKISELQMQLNIAHEEIDKLSQELIEIKKQLVSYENKIKIFKNIGIDDLTTPSNRNMSTPLSSHRRKGKKNNSMRACKTLLEKFVTKQDIFINPNQSPKNILETKAYMETREQSMTITKNRCTALSTKKKRSVHILGDEQIIGLSSAIAKSRAGKWNDDYQPNAFIRSNADSYHVLSFCDNVKQVASKDDIVVLCAGSHDSNPAKFNINLSIALDKLSHVKIVYVLPVLFNSHLNERLLNNNIRLITQNFRWCKFIEINTSIKSQRSYINHVCLKLNSLIDFVRYESEYLHVKHVKNHHLRNQGLEQPSKGTIPFYFRKKKEQSLREETKITCPMNKKNRVITDYFPKTNDKIFFRA